MAGNEPGPVGSWLLGVPWPLVLGPWNFARSAYNSSVFAFFQTVTPVVELPDAAPAKEVGPADVLIGSIGLVGALVVLALLAGLAVGGLFILRR